MIRVETKLLPRPSISDAESSLAVAVVNSAVTAYADYLEKETPQLYCASHPDHTAVIRVEAESVSNLRAEMHSFCCREFASQVKILPPVNINLQNEVKEV